MPGYVRQMLAAHPHVGDLAAQLNGSAAHALI